MEVQTFSSAPTIVELYTSQGCSSCPPADELLSEYVNDPSVALLAFHVDYWNYIGWTDPHSKPEFSQRQRDSERKRGSNRVYTPQMIVDGHDVFVGSRRDHLEKSLRIKRTEKTVGVVLRVSKDGVVVTLSGALPSSGAVLNVALTNDGVVDHVNRGENIGRTLKEDGVVVWFVTFKLSVEDSQLQIDNIDVKKGNKVIAYVQDAVNQKVIGSCQLRL